jgi:hypothetical protein
MYGLNDLWGLWYSIFFHPQYSTVLSLCRMLFALICVAKAISLWKYADQYLGPDGLYGYDEWKKSNEYKSYFSFFHCVSNSIQSVYGILCGLLVSSLFLFVGFYTELSAIFTYLFWISITHRNVYIFNSGDSLLRIMLFLLIFSGSGYGLSIDNYLYERNQFYTTVNPWVWRLMQFCIINVYLQSVYVKINDGKDWRDGTALYYCLNNKSFDRFMLGLGTKITRNIAFVGSWSTLLIEVICPIGLCFKETNAASLFLLFGLHIGSEILLSIGMFGILMMVCLCLFIDPVWGAEAVNSLYQILISGQ